MAELSPTEFPKRFYKQAQSVEAGSGWTVELDGRALKTPAKSPLILPFKTLAQSIAEEWSRQ